MNSSILKLESVSKIYNNILDSTEIQALSPLSLEIAKPGLYLISGTNGTGKTTLMNIIAGIVRPSSGKGEILGQKLNDYRDKLNIGYSPDILPKFPQITAKLFFETLTSLKTTKIKLKKELDSIIHLFEISDWVERPLQWYSAGMLKRISLISALFHDPDLILLDEPLENLDDKGKEILEKILSERLNDKKTVIMTSHIIKDDGFSVLDPKIIHIKDLFL